MAAARRARPVTLLRWFVPGLGGPPVAFPSICRDFTARELSTTLGLSVAPLNQNGPHLDMGWLR